MYRERGRENCTKYSLEMQTSRSTFPFTFNSKLLDTPVLRSSINISCVLFVPEPYSKHEQDKKEWSIGVEEWIRVKKESWFDPGSIERIECQLLITHVNRADEVSSFESFFPSDWWQFVPQNILYVNFVFTAIFRTLPYLVRTFYGYNPVAVLTSKPEKLWPLIFFRTDSNASSYASILLIQSILLPFFLLISS